MGEDPQAQLLSAYEAYAEALFRHCYFRVYDRELAKDLVQEAFCRAWSHLAEGREVRNIRAFLYRILRNAIVDETRKRRGVSLDELVEEGFTPADTSGPSLEDKLLVREVAEKLKLLREPYREAVQMRYIDDLNPKEIAEILGQSENVVSVRIHRGVAKLRKLLGGASEGT